mmetsp:Transcript_5905/g.16101  ORF Transcript_5905/g.16101 Transcript_5905/m.16101 type:complete len:217 (+) Transcript_5905:1387-2037(+)
MASCPPESELPSCLSAYASSMKRTPPRAFFTASAVSCPVSPWWGPMRSLRVTSTSWPVWSTPRDRIMRATSLATLVLPVPGLPRKSMLSTRSSFTPRCLRRFCTSTELRSDCSIPFTSARPTSCSTSLSRAAMSSAGGRAGPASPFWLGLDPTPPPAPPAPPGGAPRATAATAAPGPGPAARAAARSKTPAAAASSLRTSASSNGMYRPCPGVHRK